MKSIYLYISTFFLFSLSACKKEYPTFPYTDILSFSVNDANGKALKALIENDEIILNWPAGQAVPKEITPAIVIADKASILPLAGTKVSVDQPVTYTVTAQNGTAATYKLKLVVNSFIPMIKAFYGLRIYNSKTYLTTETGAQLGGDLFDVTAGKTKVYFVNTSGQDIPVKIENMTPIAIVLEPTTAIGNYQGIKVVSGNKSSVFSEKFEVIDNPVPTFSSSAISAASTVKRNAQFTISGGSNLNKITGVSLYNSATNTFTRANLKGTTANSLTVEIPATFPLGNYVILKYEYPESDYYRAGSNNFFFEDFPVTVVN